MSKSHFSIGTLLYRAIILITRANKKYKSCFYCVLWSREKWKSKGFCRKKKEHGMDANKRQRYEKISIELWFILG